MGTLTVKALKTRSGLWAIFWGTDSATKLAYHRWFKTEEVAQKWADKFYKKMINHN